MLLFTSKVLKNQRFNGKKKTFTFFFQLKFLVIYKGFFDSPHFFPPARPTRDKSPIALFENEIY